MLKLVRLRCAIVTLWLRDCLAKHTGATPSKGNFHTSQYILHHKPPNHKSYRTNFCYFILLSKEQKKKKKVLWKPEWRAAFPKSFCCKETDYYQESRNCSKGWNYSQHIKWGFAHVLSTPWGVEVGEWALLHQPGQGTMLPIQGHWGISRAGAASSDLSEQEQIHLNPTEASDHGLWFGQHCKFSTGQECMGGFSLRRWHCRRDLLTRSPAQSEQEPWAAFPEHPERAQGPHSTSLPMQAHVCVQTEKKRTHTSVPGSLISQTSKLCWEDTEKRPGRAQFWIVTPFQQLKVLIAIAVKIVFLCPESSKMQVAQHLWRSGGALGVSTTLPGVWVGQGSRLRVAQGFEERPAQLKLVCWQYPAPPPEVKWAKRVSSASLPGHCPG